MGQPIRKEAYHYLWVLAPSPDAGAKPSAWSGEGCYCNTESWLLSMLQLRSRVNGGLWSRFHN
jgi:hypothetical protein